HPSSWTHQLHHHDVSFQLLRRPLTPTLFPYTTLFRSAAVGRDDRRSGGLDVQRAIAADELADEVELGTGFGRVAGAEVECRDARDRKSTRLNSSHVSISYAVFCLKKKKHTDGVLP